jgi:glycosyltransferase involved in cell wall biosynthesis
MNNVRLTVAMPVKDGSNYIREALNSILGQTFGDFLVVVSENGSSDDTVDILEEYARLDKRVRFYSEPEPLGHTGNFNRVMQLCETPWIKLICHDDLIRKDALSQIDAAISDSAEAGVGIISNGNRHIFDDRLVSAEVRTGKRLYSVGREAIIRFLQGRERILIPSISNCTVRKDVWEAAGRFDERFLHQDVPAWIYALTKTNIFFLEDTLTFVRVHDAQLTNFSRRSGHSIHDFRIFFDEFLEEYGEELDIDLPTRVRARLKPLTPASIISQRLIKAGEWSAVREVLSGLPAGWLPLLPPIMLRTWVKEHSRKERMVETLRPYDPASEGIAV